MYNVTLGNILKLNHTQAAKAAGISRKTLYNHVEKGKVSQGKDEDGNPVYDVSELIRVYPDFTLEVTDRLQGKGVHSIQIETPLTQLSDTPNSTVELDILKLKFEHMERERDIEKERREKSEQLHERAEDRITELTEVVKKQTYMLSAPLEAAKPEQKTDSKGFWGRVLS